MPQTMTLQTSEFALVLFFRPICSSFYPQYIVWKTAFFLALLPSAARGRAQRSICRYVAAQ